MKYNPSNVGEKGPYCGVCIVDGVLVHELICKWCNGTRNLEVVTTTNGEVRLCKNCYKPWIRNADRLSWNTISEGLEHRWKKLRDD